MLFLFVLLMVLVVLALAPVVVARVAALIAAALGDQPVEDSIVSA